MVANAPLRFMNVEEPLRLLIRTGLLRASFGDALRPCRYRSLGSPDPIRLYGPQGGVSIAAPMTALGPGCVKTKSDLVVMPSGGRIFVFFRSAHDHRAQNSSCGYTASSFHTAWVINCRAEH